MQNITYGTFLKGNFWPEKIKVLFVKDFGNGQMKIEAVGVETETYYNRILSQDDLDKIEIYKEEPYDFSVDGESLFLFLESHRIRNAFQFDPLYAVNVSQIDPLPHQIEAVYHYILQNPRIRFLLADDPGAGKTIMTGLLIKELKYRGLAERILIVVPGHLKDQWLREMKDKFSESFKIVDRSVMNSAWGQNIFNESNQLIISMDFAKQDDVLNVLRVTRWDLCVIDEAHKMAAYKYGEKISKTQRYTFGEVLGQNTNYFLFLTATPHRGDPENFRLLLDLLEPGFFANTEMLAESIRNKDNPLFLRRLKEDLKDFTGAPLFTPRVVETMKFRLSDEEKTLYNAVTDYVEKFFNKALEKEKRNVTFALTILQRRLASSARAIRKSLERRFERLSELYKKGQLLQDREYIDEEALEDYEEKERWNKEEDLLEKLTSADTLEELKNEIGILENLVKLAKEVEKKETETKLTELKKVIDTENIDLQQNKLLIFTESKDTLEYLAEKLGKWGYSVATIHGGMNLDARIRAEHDFKSTAQIMISTEAGGEGINLQFCWLMVNYDIPWNPNRLEQRMGRVHRYGQTHEVHIYNLVAIDTREGVILNRLFEKLDQIRVHLGSDRVFDVIGELIVGKSLKDLIVDAISNRRTMDDILKDFERVPDNELIEKLKEVTTEALATRHIDMTRIFGEQRSAKENKLVPEYIEEFFKKSSRLLNIDMKKLEDGLWKIQSVPHDIRNQNYSFKIKYGEVYREYAKVSFDKEKAHSSQAEFVATGHPLLEAVIERIFQLYSQHAAKGALFTDPEGKYDGYIWFVESEIKDGKGETAGKRIFSAYQDGRNNFSLINPAIIWDLKPVSARDEKIENMPGNETVNTGAVLSFIVQYGIEDYKKEIAARRERDAEIKKKYGIKSLEYMILDSDAKIMEYETRRGKGENIPEATIQNEQRKKEELTRKQERLKKEVEQEVHLLPDEPKIISVIKVVPEVIKKEMTGDREIELIGMKLAIEYEKIQSRFPEDVSAQNLGFDIRSSDSQGNCRYIEVKSKAHEGSVALTPNEWLMAQRLKEEYWLYIVVNAVEKPELYLINNPADKLKPSEEIDIVRYVIKNWQEKAEVAK